jgi:hypothetical protein
MLIAMLLAGTARAEVLDRFDTADRWHADPSTGVDLRLSTDTGRTGRALRIDFDFRGGGGYGIARLPLKLDLPENYEFSFWIRGETPVNTLEFKLVDPSGENVWWTTRPRWRFPTEWTRLRIKKRHLNFAWGPQGGGEIRQASALEIVVTAAEGGRGTVWVDDLTFTALPPERPYDLTPATSWRGNNYEIDFLRGREFGGAVIHWGSSRPADYEVQLSDDRRQWTTVWRARGAAGARDFIRIPEGESRYLRVVMAKRTDLRNVEVLEPAVGETKNAFFEHIARSSPKGLYPRYLLGEQSYWTIVGAPADEGEALINEEGAIDIDPIRFSVEPFLQIEPVPHKFKIGPDGEFRVPGAGFREGETGGNAGDSEPRSDNSEVVSGTGNQQPGSATGVPAHAVRLSTQVVSPGTRNPEPGTPVKPPVHAVRLSTWADGTHTQTLADGELPIPTVVREHGDIRLSVTAWDRGEAGHSVLWVRYRLENLAPYRMAATLHLALRPLQVNPPWQFLAIRGGSTEVLSIARQGDDVVVNGTTRIVPVTALSAFGAFRFDQGDAVTALNEGRAPVEQSVDDPFGSASGVMSWRLELGINESRDVVIAIPFHARPAYLRGALAPELASKTAEEELNVSAAAWRSRLGRVAIELPGDAGRISRAIRSQLAYILINQDGPSIEPGARSYDRSWIRDGSLTSAALLRLGHAEEVRNFIEWYARHQREDGYVPCCVDSRGADPVPEHDSHGQFIYLINEYFEFTKDRKFLERMWPHVASTVAFIDRLRHERMTPEYRTEEKRPFFGLVPESISHEGYSAKPMHSYWDNTFILRGLKDAVSIAETLCPAAARGASGAGSPPSEGRGALRAPATPVAAEPRDAPAISLVAQPWAAVPSTDVQHAVDGDPSLRSASFGMTGQVLRQADVPPISLMAQAPTAVPSTKSVTTPCAAIAPYRTIRDEFQRDFHASMAVAMARHQISYLPGSVELGDFDATSTTTMVNPGGETRELYESLRRTFDQYWENFVDRRSGKKEWVDYTPYEWRVVGTFIRLGERQRAHEAMEWFFSHSRPSGWNHWAEVVFADPLTPRFIGDMPHTWVGSDFIRSMIDFFAYERERDQALVLGAGVLYTWTARGEGVNVRALRTPYGTLSYSMKAEGDRGLRIRIEEGIDIPPGGIVVVSPIDGRETVIRQLPADVRLGPAPKEGTPTAPGVRTAP